ncbi:hypothetical protein [Thalassotalea sp. PLHSN55]|uniref:hypothetical protein n=1 Tax=Thalassotalea sp. PLHSN55 TaxID=3435888 RepID=UPI003F82D62F
MKNILIASLAIALIGGCSTRVGDFTVASTKNINIKSGQHKVLTEERLTGEDVKYGVLIIPAGIPNMKEAMDNAIEKKQGAVGLSDVVVNHSYWGIPFIYSQRSYTIEGNPIIEVSGEDKS